MRLRAPAAALLAVLLLAAALGGCGFGAGERSTDARVLVPRDFGARTLADEVVADLPESETVMRLTTRLFDVDTRYGGDFVQAIDGLAGGRRDGSSYDWLLYLNGIRTDVGASDVPLFGGDVVWWDYHAWDGGDTQAVVGAFPEPFAHGAGGKRFPMVLECAEDAEAACDAVAERLEAVDSGAARQRLGTGVGERTLRVLVGTWDLLRRDHALAQLDDGPRRSGVFARFTPDGRSLELLDADGRAGRTLGAGAGLVAATRFEDQAPTWAITGTDADGVLAAASALTPERLRQTYALAVDGDADVPLPLRR